MAGHYRGGRRAQELEDKGYGRAHRAQRKKWARIIKVEGWVQCYCGAEDCSSIIRDGDDWDLGHTEDRLDWTGPEIPAHNRAKGARNKNLKTRRLTQIAEDVLRTGNTSGVIERPW